MLGTYTHGRCPALRVLIDGMDPAETRTLATGLIEALSGLRIPARGAGGALHGPAPGHSPSEPPRPWRLVAAALTEALRTPSAAPEVLVQRSAAEHRLALVEGLGHCGASLALRALLPIAPRFDLVILLVARPETLRRRALDRRGAAPLDALLLQDPRRFRRIETRLHHLISRRGATIIETDGLSGSELLAAALAEVLTRLGLATEDRLPRTSTRDRGRAGGGIGLPVARRRPAYARARRVHGVWRV